MKVVSRLVRKITYKYSMTQRGCYTIFKEETEGRTPYKKKACEKQKVHVIANGPSANDTIPYIRNGEDVIVVNYALRDEKIRKLMPKMLVIIDPEFAEKEDGLNYLGEIYDYIKEGIVDKIVLNSTIYMKWKETYSVDHVEVLNMRSRSNQYDSQRDRNAYEKNIYAPMFQTVPIAALYVAIQEGYKEIILHGNDFNFFKEIVVDEQCHMCMLDKHFYGEKKHDYTTLYGMDFESELTSELRAIRGYKQLKAYALDEGATIYNVSLNSMLDMFEKKHIEDICLNTGGD